MFFIEKTVSGLLLLSFIVHSYGTLTDHDRSKMNAYVNDLSKFIKTTGSTEIKPETVQKLTSTDDEFQKSILSIYQTKPDKAYKAIVDSIETRMKGYKSLIDPDVWSNDKAEMHLNALNRMDFDEAIQFIIYSTFPISEPMAVEIERYEATKRFSNKQAKIMVHLNHFDEYKNDLIAEVQRIAGREEAKISGAKRDKEKIEADKKAADEIAAKNKAEWQAQAENTQKATSSHKTSTGCLGCIRCRR